MIDLYSKIYSQTYKRKGIPMRVIVPLMRLLERKACEHLEKQGHIYRTNPLNPERILSGVIVSLTSFPARINNVWKTVLSLKRQSYLPEKIILWLSLEEFPDKKVPGNLKEMEDDFFEIKFFEGNLKPHNKYFQAIKNYGQYRIITVDDDEYYRKDIIKLLIENAEKYPDSIIANRIMKIPVSHGPLIPYNKWSWRIKKKDDKDLFQLGVGGVLYPPSSLPEDVLDEKAISDLCLLADDIWLNAMTRLKGTRVVWTGWKYRNLPILSDGPKLEDLNCVENLNDRQISAVREFIVKKKGIDVYRP